jgi:hypothetical protein
MKIARIFLTLQGNASSGSHDNVWSSIFKGTLLNMGYDVVFYSYGDALASVGSKNLSNLNKISENIYNTFSKHHKQKPFDLFLSYFHSGNVTPELFRKVKELTFCVNYTTNFHQIELFKALLKEANLSVYTSKEAANYFSENNYPGYYMPFAGLKKYSGDLKNKKNRVSFIGTSYGNRPYYIWRCLQNKLPIDIYGANWKQNNKKRAVLRTLLLEGKLLTDNSTYLDTAYRILNDCILMEVNKDYSSLINGPLSDKEYFDLLAKSAIVLNFPESRYNHDYQNHKVLIGANLRDFEVPMAGSLLLTQDNEELRSFFQVGEEIETFCNEWEMIDKIKFYLKHTSLNLKIAAAGHKKVCQEHTWEHRFKLFFTHLEQNYL